MAKFSFKDMKEKLKGNVIKEKKSYDDERLWKLAADKENNGSALVRLLPGKVINGNGTPAVVQHTFHSIFIKTPEGKWKIYNEKSPATFGKKCPVTEAFFELKNAGEEYSEISKKLQRRTKILTNILIKKDIQNPDNNGEIKIWEMPKSIWDSCLAVLDPSDQELELGKKAKELFDLQEGNDLLISRSGKGLNTSYSVTFQDKEPLCSESENEKYLSKVYDLSEFIDEKNYDDYNTLKLKFAKTIAGTDIEEALLAVGSKVITKPYDSEETVTKKEENTVYTPKPKTEEPKKEVEDTPPFETESSTSDDSIDDLLNDL